MAKRTNSEATPVAPSDVGRNDNTIVAGEGTSQQVAFALAATGKAQGGYDLHELRVRLAAVGAPQWSRNVGAGDFNWLARQPFAPATARGRRGACHTYPHTTPKGTATACDVRHGTGSDVCGKVAKSQGDNVRRWAYEGYEVAPALATVDSTIEAAKGRLSRVVATLLAAGMPRERIDATPGIATLQATLGKASVSTPKARKPRKARATRKASDTSEATSEVAKATEAS